MLLDLVMVVAGGMIGIAIAFFIALFCLIVGTGIIALYELLRFKGGKDV